MTNAILLRSRVNRKVQARFWSRVGRGDPLGLGSERRIFFELMSGVAYG